MAKEDTKASEKKETTAKAKAKAELVVETQVINDKQEEATLEPVKSTAKAGKRSSKALKEDADKEAKEERKTSTETGSEEDKPKVAVISSRSRLERRGKQFKKSAELIEKDKLYNLDEALALAKKTSHVKFDATVEMHINLGVDPRQADQNIRDTLVLPSGSGKNLRVAVLSDDVEAAKKAGAEIAGADEIFAELDKGNINFDVLIATPNQMPQLGKYARLLGPRGLMPNPKSGTVTTDISKATNEAKGGRVEYRVDSTGIVHLGVGKVSFSEAQLKDNTEAVLSSIRSNKPQNMKGNYIKAIHLTTSMGPAVKVELSEVV
jgi:large subunit ribosomal protein L1